MTGTPLYLTRQVLDVLRSHLSVFLGFYAPRILNSNYITSKNTKETIT